MALRVDWTSGMSYIPSLLVVLTFLIVTINGIGNYWQLTSAQVSIIGFVAFVLTGLATMLTTFERV